jgi:hypothetical protein
MKILIISLSDLARDPRVHRQIAHLRKHHEVTCIGLQPPGFDDVRFHQVGPSTDPASKVKAGVSLALHRYDALSRQMPIALHRMVAEIGNEEYDAIIANDLETISFAFRVKGAAKVILDAHEYAPSEFEDDLWWTLLNKRYTEYLCSTFLPRCDVVITVCQGIADLYQRNFHVKPSVITNASVYLDLKPTPVTESRIRIIHHGGAHPSRKIEEMIRMMDLVDPRFTLDLMLVPIERYRSYYDTLRRMADDRENVMVLDPVPMTEIVTEINRYDIGMYLLEPNNINNKYSLPNKFFEYVQARLAIAVGPSPEMARIVREYGLGVVGPDFSAETLADCINRLTPQEIWGQKLGSDAAAPTLSSEANMAILDSILKGIAPQ